MEMVGEVRWRWLAALPSVLGFAVALRCVRDFEIDRARHSGADSTAERLVVIGSYG